MKDNASTQTAAAGPSNLAEIIERAKHELEQMMDFNPQVMLLVNQDGMVVRTNRALLEFLGLSDFRDALGHRLSDLIQCETLAAFPQFVSTAVHGGDREIDVTMPSGKRVLNFRVVAPTPGSELHVVIIDDVTDFKSATVHLEKQHKMQAIEALMGALMHNINQPLTVIMVTARLMHFAIEKGSWNPEEMKKNLQTIMDLTMQISRLMDQVKVPRDFVTEAYLKGMEILDIERSAGVERDEERPG